MKLNLEITPDCINFFDENTNKIYNQIPIKNLGKTTIINGEIHSYWVEKYFNHIFIRKHHIYKLAQFINVQYPNNRMNWFAQMYKIEYYQKLLDIEYFQSGNSETFNRSLFEQNENYFLACANELSNNQEEIAKIKGKDLVELTKYNLL